jgi:DNA adenine methylase
MPSTFKIVKPVSPVAPYIGGKRNLSREIIQRIAAIPHTTYAEPFIGMGGIFLRRPFRAEAEVINDIGRELITLYRILQRHYVPFLDMLRYQITSRAEFQRLLAVDPVTLTDLERAARFLYLQRNAFGGKPVKATFGVAPGRPGRFDLQKIGPMLEELHERMSGVVIECLPFQEFIPRYDRPETLFYLDPPYYGCENDYGRDIFARADFERLAETLRGIKGRFILSLNDHPEVRRIFDGFRIDAVQVTYSIGHRGNTKAGEVIISKA